ncbi:MAG: outer membrane protein transport protein [Mariprofundaceae bacterium]|nr:outer membrane protein transport protein [Mariprofundaceae bacterium]
MRMNMKQLAMDLPGMKRHAMKGAAVAIAFCISITAAQAGGFSNPNMSASGLGVANAVVAGADDVSAAAYNPAGIAWQDGIQAMLGVDLQYRNNSVKLASGVGSNSGGAGNPSHLYASWMPHEGSVGISLAYNTPYELDNDWVLAFPASIGRSKLKINRLSLDAIYALNSSLAVSGGIDWYLSSVDITTPGQGFSARDSTSFGGHISMKWKPAPMWSVGALARLGSNIDFSGGTAQALSVKLPDELTVGVSYDVADAVRIELDAAWSRWSRLKDLNVMSGATVLQSHPLSMSDSLTAMLGVTWFWRENSQFRFGYAYDQEANKSAAFNPVVADQTGHKASLGAGGDMFGFHADLAYAYTFYPKRTVTGIYAGTYRDRRHSLALSVSKRF